ncbi:MAG: ComEA family DNA-binding protein [Gemmatimonadaceae bacterium]
MPPGPRTSGLPVHLDRASAAELEGLPGIGPALARRIVEDREKVGPFGSLSALQRVKGVGKRLAERLAPLVTFGFTGRPSSVISVPEPASTGTRRESRHRTARTAHHW